MQPYYKKKFKFKKNDFLNSVKFYESAISLPIFYNLKKKDINTSSILFLATPCEGKYETRKFDSVVSSNFSSLAYDARGTPMTSR